MRRRGWRSGSVQLLAMVVLILGPGLALGYFGFRALAEREQALRINYTATTVLVRDRLSAELSRLEAAVVPSSEPRGLAALEAGHPWLEKPFVLRADGGLVTSRLCAGTDAHPTNVLARLPAIAGIVAGAEHQEFARGDRETALRLYRRALSRAREDDLDARAFLLTRVGRTLFKLQRFGEGTDAYRVVAATAGDGVDRNGLPYRAIAMLQIIDGYAALQRPEELAAARRQYVRYVLDNPWDLDNGYRQHLARAIQDISPAETAARVQAAALMEEVAAIDWIRGEVVRGLSRGLAPQDGTAAQGRHVVIPGDRPRVVSYRPIDGGREGAATVLAYLVRMEYVGGPLLAEVLKTVDLGDDLHVVFAGHEDARVNGSRARPAAPLAGAELLPAIPQWKVELFDKRGRSMSELVARERWTYGALVAGMLTVMAVGVALTLRASARAAELARTRSDFVSNVSHELKTPLALIRMFGETLASGIVGDPVKRQEFSTIITRESERLTHLIDNVLDLGRIDQGTRQYEFRRQDVVATVRSALEAYRPLFDRSGFTVETSFPQTPVPASIDRDAVVQSLVNLLQNVIKYSGSARHVSVTVERVDGSAYISVADRGVGIDADHVDRIFDRYYRVPNAATGAPSGSGLGLAIVKHHVDAHGGRVHVRSAPGEGTTFTVVLPAEADRPGPSPFPASAGPVNV